MPVIVRREKEDRDQEIVAGEVVVEVDLLETEEGLDLGRDHTATHMTQEIGEIGMTGIEEMEKEKETVMIGGDVIVGKDEIVGIDETAEIGGIVEIGSHLEGETAVTTKEIDPILGSLLNLEITMVSQQMIKIQIDKMTDLRMMKIIVKDKWKKNHIMSHFQEMVEILITKKKAIKWIKGKKIWMQIQNKERRM